MYRHMHKSSYERDTLKGTKYVAIVSNGNHHSLCEFRSHSCNASNFNDDTNRVQPTLICIDVSFDNVLSYLENKCDISKNDYHLIKYTKNDLDYSNEIDRYLINDIISHVNYETCHQLSINNEKWNKLIHTTFACSLSDHTLCKENSYNNINNHHYVHIYLINNMSDLDIKLIVNDIN